MCTFAISEAGLRHLAFAGLFVLGCGFPAAAQTAAATPQTMLAAGATGQQAPDPQTPGTISGTVVDKSGAALVGAIVKLTRGDQALAPDVQTDDNGQYSLTKIAPGPYQVSVSANGFTTVTSSGTLNPGQTMLVPAITLEIAGTVTK
ncbi:MAG TPA: carboxypeptidase-like regulatory domain-containing protein, partial [Candidatus Acidoferrum sp.]|nr:carboxypeptidase-like regulatory domain-containing protein [Candidatus Acidoferrum sp.]